MWWTTPVFVLLVKCTAPESDTECGALYKFLYNANYTVGDRLTSTALSGFTSKQERQDLLRYCAADNYGCCDEKSEQVLRQSAGDAFATISYYIVLEQTRIDLTKLIAGIKKEIYHVVTAADGPETGQLVARYVLLGEKGASIDSIVRAKLVHFVTKVYSHSWKDHCFDRLNRTRTLTSIRMFKVLSQYQHLLEGIQDGINFIPTLRNFAIKHHTKYCVDALVRAALFEDVGCKMCQINQAPASKACYEYCMNVAKGCMRPLLCYMDQWADWISHQEATTTLIRYVSGKRADFVNELQQTFETELYEEASQFRVYGECTPPEESNEGDSVKKYKASTLILPTLERTAGYFTKKFSDALSALPEQFCTRMVGYKFSQSFSCWNGHDSGGYSGPSSLFTINDQKCNPEVVAELMPCEKKKSQTCDRESYLITAYEFTPTMEPPGRSGVVRGSVMDVVVVLMMVVVGEIET